MATKKKITKRIVTAVRGVGTKVKSTVKKVVDNRVQAQKNFENRKDNSNYYGSARSWSKK